MKKIIYMYIKRYRLLLMINSFIFISITANLYADETNTDKTKIPYHQILLYVDYGYAGNSAMNDASKKGAQDIAAEYTADGNSGYSAGSTNKADINYGGDLEYRFFYEVIGFGFSAGWHQAIAETKVSNPDSDISMKVGLYVMTLNATIYYRNLINDNSFFVLGTGIGVYEGTIDTGYKGADPLVFNHGYFNEDKQRYNAISDTIGYHIKADYNYLLGPVCLTAGIGAKYVNFKEFKDEYDEKFKINAGLTGVNVYIGAGFAW